MKSAEECIVMSTKLLSVSREDEFTSDIFFFFDKIFHCDRMSSFLGTPQLDLQILLFFPLEWFHSVVSIFSANESSFNLSRNERKHVFG